ncbi:unnamed protein product [Calicophoron daubneyi]|uniref:Large ribosomal subunit protein uL15m n=1 Tax=Calicophoron daubneyi TaxID=300641 RepID=A0AAV2T2X9_CALDB
MTSVQKALQLIRYYPRVCMDNLRDLPRSLPPRYSGLKRKKLGLGHRGCSQFQAWPPLGTVGQKTPFYLSTPKEPYNADIMSRRQLARISLLELQRLIDLNRIDPNEPIDLTTFCNTKLYHLDVEHERHYGFHLTEEGADQFATAINIEVQYASELVIAAVERAGGVITTRFYDLFSVWAKSDPLVFFKQAIPIPKAKLPPHDAVPYYANPESRGYLADQSQVEECRIWLAQKYGYPVVNIKSMPDRVQSLMKMRKDKRQIFFGLTPGCLVSLADKAVLKPRMEEMNAYHQS